MANKQIEGQMNIFDFLKPIESETPEADKLRAEGWTNMYDKQPPPGFYEVCHIENPKKIWVAQKTENGWWNPQAKDMSWWRPTPYKTDGEIYQEAILHGTGFAGGKKRVIDFFAKELDQTKRAEFLKKEYGVGGWSTDYGCVDCNAGGLDFKYFKEDMQRKSKLVHSGWPMVANEISRLIGLGLYKAEVCKHSEHTCNKEELWKVAEDIGEDCPKSCCRSCSNKNCGARCNGAPKEQTKACADCINWMEAGCIVNNNFSRYHKYDADWASLPKCENKSRFYPKSMSLCENKENCDDYPIHCKGECFWCHRNSNLSGDNCLNCRKYKIECFPEHAAVHGKCEKYKVVPDFYRVMRCQLCKYWSCSTEQPPAGWGVKGYCELEKSETNASSGCCYFERGETKDEQVVDET